MPIEHAKKRHLAAWMLKFKDGHTLQVKIWARRSQMQAAVPGLDAQTIACFNPKPYYRENLHRKRLGTVHLVENDLGGGLVAHELLHGLLYWAVVTQMDLAEDEETVCWEMGSLTRQFWQRYYDISA